jgi:hypothetical protein
MPDHIHVILVLDGEGSDDGLDEGPGPRLAAGSVGSIVNHIKGASTRKIRALGHRDSGGKAGSMTESFVPNDSSKPRGDTSWVTRR